MNMSQTINPKHLNNDKDNLIFEICTGIARTQRTRHLLALAFCNSLFADQKRAV